MISKAYIFSKLVPERERAYASRYSVTEYYRLDLEQMTATLIFSEPREAHSFDNIYQGGTPARRIDSRLVVFGSSFFKANDVFSVIGRTRV